MSGGIAPKNIQEEWKQEDIKKGKQKTLDGNDDVYLKLVFGDESWIKAMIKMCEGKHIQQVVYSTYHNAFTQICFGCMEIRTSLKKEDFVKSEKEVK